MKSIYLFLLAQAMCLCNAIAGALLTFMGDRYGNTVSMVYLAYYYAIMLLCFTAKRARTWYGWKQFFKCQSTGIIDVLFNACNLYAYNYTDFASIILLVSTVVPFTMIFSAMILKSRYNYSQVLISLTILIYSVIFTLVDRNNFAGGNQKLYGNLLAIASAIGFGLNIVLMEKFSTNVDTFSYLGTQSISGVTVSLIFTLSLELKSLKTLQWQNLVLGIPYSVLFAGYMFICLFLTQRASALLYNLSNLCTNGYTFIISILILRKNYLWLQVIPVLGVVITLVIYYVSFAQITLQQKEALLKTEAKHNEKVESKDQDQLPMYVQ